MSVKEPTDFYRELGQNGRSLATSSHIGISTLPDQYVNLQLKKGFTLNILCVGETGIGKSSLLHTLFRRPFTDTPHPTRCEEVSLCTNSYEMQEASVNLRLTFIESLGFGDQIDKSSSTKNIVAYIDHQFELYLKEEMKINRNMDTFLDSRVHICLYMISPTGHSLNSLDIIAMKELQTRVNLIPVIGKADILTKSELKEFKSKVLDELKENSIHIYHFPTDDISTSAKNSEMNEKQPFAVVGSAEEEMINNQLCRVRKYPWGTVVVDDDIHCEFLHLREMLLRSNLYDLLRITHYKFYENYRALRYSSTGLPLNMEFSENLKKKHEEIAKNTEIQVKILEEEHKRNEYKLKMEYETQEALITEKFQMNLKSIGDKTITKPPCEREIEELVLENNGKGHDILLKGCKLLRKLKRMKSEKTPNSPEIAA